MSTAVKHLASPKFWACYKTLPKEIKVLADKNFRLLKSDQKHPSLHFKQIGKYGQLVLEGIIAHSV